MAIGRLLDFGCETIFINTHHLAEQIHNFIDCHPQRQRLKAVYEPALLDTGGAVANLKSQLNGDNFFVVNADIICDFDLNLLMAAHRDSDAVATLLVCHCPRFNTVQFEADTGDRAAGQDNIRGRIISFKAPRQTGVTFTGIQAVSPDIFHHMPNTQVFSSIDVYTSLCASHRIRGLKANRLYWQDMGTPQSYTHVSRQFLAGKIFGLAPDRFSNIVITPIAGDGSDRKWFRAAVQGQGHRKKIVFSDHGICLAPSSLAGKAGQRTADSQPGAAAQLNAYTAIGRHLARCGIPVPDILEYDTVSGQVALTDLGSTHLADMVDLGNIAMTRDLYQQVIDGLIHFSRAGIQGFDTSWTCQTPSYSKSLIMEMECRYFMDSFVRNYLDYRDPPNLWETLRPVFEYIADRALAHGYQGLMHRDCQSKNIMIHKGKIWFIDFQSARKGPIQYDLASLLIDPYVKLPQVLQEQLLEYTLDRLTVNMPEERQQFKQSYRYCALTRNFQILGAFGFLSRIKHKTQFETYIPDALAGLKRRLADVDNDMLAALEELINRF
ncbi:MAG: nucleoside-diphosphate-sugar pyrophosphorylase [Desulfobacterales bacterium]|nr:MAG: nucleoside-diphosphate-sugar pyrophosphorylase [Desulfobacterales bacterium]